MNRKVNLLKNTLILSIGTIIPKISSFIILPIMTAYMTKSEYGVYDLVLIICALFLPVITIQIQSAAFRFLVDVRTKKKQKKCIITNVLFFSIVCSLGAILIMYFFLNSYSTVLIILVSLYFFGDMLYGVLGQIARGLSYNNIFAQASVANSLTNLFCIYLFVYLFRWGLKGGLLALVASVYVPTIIIFFRMHIYQYIDFKLLSLSEIKRMLGYSWPMVPNTMSMWIMNVSDRIVISFFLGVEANAIYAVANKIPNILTIAQSTFTMAWQENASIAVNDDDVANYYSEMFSVIIRLMSSISLALLCLLPVLFSVLVKGEYQQSYMQIPILILAMFFYSLSSFLGGIYVAKKKTINIGVTTVVAACLNLITNFLLIKYIGLYAASLSTLVSYVFLFFYRMINLKRFVRISYNYKKMICIFILLVIVCLLTNCNNPLLYLSKSIICFLIIVYINRKIIRNFFRKII